MRSHQACTTLLTWAVVHLHAILLLEEVLCHAQAWAVGAPISWRRVGAGPLTSLGPKAAGLGARGPLCPLGPVAVG